MNIEKNMTLDVAALVLRNVGWRKKGKRRRTNMAREDRRLDISSILSVISKRLEKRCVHGNIDVML